MSSTREDASEQVLVSSPIWLGKQRDLLIPVGFSESIGGYCVAASLLTETLLGSAGFAFCCFLSRCVP